jgi:hypothetical protein
MTVTDLNPNEKWAITITLSSTWSNGNGISYLYNIGYQCTKVSGRYAPGYWNKKIRDDNKIWYSFHTFACLDCDPTRTDILDWNYWGSLGQGC